MSQLTATGTRGRQKAANYHRDALGFAAGSTLRGRPGRKTACLAPTVTPIVNAMWFLGGVVPHMPDVSLLFR
jgi:hypothetical protein